MIGSIPGMVRSNSRQLQIEPSYAEGIHQHTVIVANGLKADPDRQAIVPQDHNQAHEVFGRVGKGYVPTARLAGGGNQHLVPDSTAPGPLGQPETDDYHQARISLSLRDDRGQVKTHHRRNRTKADHNR